MTTDVDVDSEFRGLRDWWRRARFKSPEVLTIYGPSDMERLYDAWHAERERVAALTEALRGLAYRWLPGDAVQCNVCGAVWMRAEPEERHKADCVLDRAALAGREG